MIIIGIVSGAALVILARIYQVLRDIRRELVKFNNNMVTGIGHINAYNAESKVWPNADHLDALDRSRDPDHR